MEPLGSERHRPWPTRVSFREKANQSKCASTNYPKSLSHTGYTKRPRRESNPHLRFRKPLFYPLNYGDNDSGKNRLIEWRWATCRSCPQRFGEGRLCLDSPREGKYESDCFHVSLACPPRSVNRSRWRSRIVCLSTVSVI